jgi:hypothetical protein
MESLTSPVPEPDADADTDTATIDGFRKRYRWRFRVLRVCLLSLFLTATWFWPIGSQYVEIPPSFPCKTATEVTEKAICADPLLEKVDADFAVYYQDNLAAAALFRATAIESQLKKSESDFIVARNRCGRNRWCIERQYLYQDVRISDMSGEPHRTTVPLRVYLDHYLGAYLKIWLRAAVLRREDRQRRTQIQPESRPHPEFPAESAISTT